jgi:hypothetical protein
MRLTTARAGPAGEVRKFTPEMQMLQQHTQ